MGKKNNTRVSYIYNNESDRFWFKIKAKFGQFFKKEKNKNSDIRSSVRGQLEDLKSDYNLYYMKKDELCQRVFGEFNTIRLRHGKDISSLADISKLGDALTSESASDRKKKNGFFKLVSEPLMQLKDMDSNSEEYRQKRAEIVANIDKYLKKHNPSTKMGKARCEFAERLRFLLNEEAQIEVDEEFGVEDEDNNSDKSYSDDDSFIDEDELNIENKEVKNNKAINNKIININQIDVEDDINEVLNIDNEIQKNNSREKTSFNELVEKSNISLSKNMDRNKAKQDPVLSLS